MHLRDEGPPMKDLTPAPVSTTARSSSSVASVRTVAMNSSIRERFIVLSLRSFSIATCATLPPAWLSVRTPICLVLTPVISLPDPLRPNIYERSPQ